MIDRANKIDQLKAEVFSFREDNEIFNRMAVSEEERSARENDRRTLVDQLRRFIGSATVSELTDIFNIFRASSDDFTEIVRHEIRARTGVPAEKRHSFQARSISKDVTGLDN